METDNHDLIDLNNLAERQKELRTEWENTKNLFTYQSCEVLKLKNKMDILAGHIKDNEELIRIKKLSINIKPR